MARIFDVIEYPNEMKDEIVHRFPEAGIGDFRVGSQVIVRESQAAVFFRDGNALRRRRPFWRRTPRLPTLHRDV